MSDLSGPEFDISAAQRSDNRSAQSMDAEAGRSTPADPEFAGEQAHLSRTYARLEDMRDALSRRVHGPQG